MDLPKLRPPERISASRFIVIGDTFKTHEKALKLFGHANSGKGIKPSTYFFGTKKVVWFPKIAIEDKEHRLVPPKDYIDWCNTLSSDYSELLQRWAGGERENADDNKFNNLALEFAVFAMLPNKKEEYTFLGIYRKQPQNDLYGSEVYHQKEKELSIDDWIEAAKNAKQE